MLHMTPLAHPAPRPSPLQVSLLLGGDEEDVAAARQALQPLAASLAVGGRVSQTPLSMFH